jgi:hypothetical protein
MHFLVRCPPEGEGVCDGYDDLGACLPGGAPGDSNRSEYCCDNRNASYAAHCCSKTCHQLHGHRQPYIYDPSLASARQRVNQSTGLGGRLDLSRFNCGSAIIDPSYVAVCVCDPEDQVQTKCSWITNEPAPLRLRLFVQESMIAVLLLLNYAAVALEHVLRGQHDAAPACQQALISVAYLSIPLFIALLSFRVKAYASQHDSASAALSWLWAGTGFTAFLLQVRFYWISGLGMLYVLARQAKQQRGTWMMAAALVASGVAWLTVSLAHNVGSWSAFWGWIAEDLTLALTLFCVRGAVLRRWSTRKMCAVSGACCVLIGTVFLVCVLIGIAGWAWIGKRDREGGLSAARHQFVDATIGAGPTVTSIIMTALWQQLMMVGLVSSCRVCGSPRLWRVLLPQQLRQCSCREPASVVIVPNVPVAANGLING